MQEAASQAESLVMILAVELKSEPLALHTLSDQQAKSQTLPSRVHKLISRYKAGIMGETHPKECDYLL